MTTEYDRLVAEQAQDISTDNERDEALHEQLQEDTEVEELDVDTDYEDDETEDVVDAPTESAENAKAKEPKAPAKPKRGELPEGYITPVGLAKVITELGLHGQDDDGTNRNCPPQVVYSYIKNAPKEHPFPLETVNDSNGQPRQALLEAAGVEWWKNKNARVAERKANAAAKADKAAAVKAAKAKADASTEAGTPEAEVEAEEAE